MFNARYNFIFKKFKAKDHLEDGHFSLRQSGIAVMNDGRVRILVEGCEQCQCGMDYDLENDIVMFAELDLKAIAEHTDVATLIDLVRS